MFAELANGDLFGDGCAITLGTDSWLSRGLFPFSGTPWGIVGGGKVGDLRLLGDDGWKFALISVPVGEFSPKPPPYPSPPDCSTDGIFLPAIF